MLAYAGTKAGDWRMPTRTELSKWASNITSISRNQGDNGLRLCDSYSGYGSARCYGYNGGAACPGSNDGICDPDDVWSSTPTGSYYYSRYLYYGSFNENYTSSRYAF